MGYSYKPELKKCTSENGKHSWEWVKDTTEVTVKSSNFGSSKKLSRKGVYQCRCCPEKKLGTARSGL